MLKKILGLFLLSNLLLSCEKKPTPNPEPQLVENAVLIYMCADNNLYSYGKTNLSQMESEAKKGALGNNRVFVYLDPPTPELPKLLEVTSDGIKTVEAYSEEQNSASKEVLQQTIARFKQLAPAKKYGLVLWSHASGWMFTDVKIKSASEQLLSPQQLSPTGIPVEEGYYDYPLTKSYGVGTYGGQSYQIDIPDLKTALKDNEFEAILFDCCYMGSVEVLYELRNKAHYFIASPTEVLAAGFAYYKCFEDIASLNLESLCSRYYHAYADNSSYATVALIDGSQLEQLAQTVKTITTAHSAEIDALNPRDLQCFDRYSYHFIYDLGEYMEKIATPTERSAFNLSLEKTVKAKYYTPLFISFSIAHFSGLSSFVPGKLQYNNANNRYKELEWYKHAYSN